MPDRAFLVDTTRCIGCRSCQTACKQWNELPAEKTNFFPGYEYTDPSGLSALTWNYVDFRKVNRRSGNEFLWSIIHKKCNHCKDANCAAVCPTDAVENIDGWKIINRTKCIGCGKCTEACLYKVPRVSTESYYNSKGAVIIEKGKSYKCNACTAKGRTDPACVKNCPTGALTYNYRLVVLKEANLRSKKLRKRYPETSIYGIFEYGGLRVITLLKEKPERYGLPVGDFARSIRSSKLNEIREVYLFLSMFTFGLPVLKRKALKIAERLCSS